MQFPSKLIENAVAEIAKLPGIGKKTALRLALHLLKEDGQETSLLTDALARMRSETVYCKQCHNISDADLCQICDNPLRDGSSICVVEDTRDVMAVENTAQYHGQYHILGGVISPMDGIGPGELNIESLINRAKSADGLKEIILALSPTMEGDTTAFYITKKLKDLDIKLSTIARGVPVGGELEYTDEITLGRSILSRTKYEV